MDLNRIATFVRVVEAQSFTAAARALGASKSSVSRVVSQLEAELGVRLLQRTTRKQLLTDAGQAYYTRARQALAELDEATVAVSDMGAEPRGVVRITAPLDIGLMVLSEAVAAFTEKYPLIHVELSLTGRVVNLVQEGFDLALRGGVLPDSALVARKLATSALGLFASPGYLARHGEPKNPGELTRHRCVLFRARDGKASWALSSARGEVSVEVTGSVSSDDLLFTHRAVVAGMGIGAFPLFMAARCPDRNELTRVLPEYSFQGGALYLVMPSAKQVPARVSLFRDFLVERFAAVDWGSTLAAPRSKKARARPTRPRPRPRR